MSVIAVSGWVRQEDGLFQVSLGSSEPLSQKQNKARKRKQNHSTTTKFIPVETDRKCHIQMMRTGDRNWSGRLGT